jgi:RNA recognition motif-containing protein
MGQKLFVGGISVATTNEGLRQLFAQCGTVLSANVVIDELTGHSRGFAFVEMATAEEAHKAITDLKWHELDGRRLNVDVAKPQTNGSR